MSPASKAQQRAVAKYENKVYDKYLVRIPKGQKATVQAAAEQEGDSINGYTNKALLARMGLEEWPGKAEQEDTCADASECLGLDKHGE